MRNTILSILLLIAGIISAPCQNTNAYVEVIINYRFTGSSSNNPQIRNLNLKAWAGERRGDSASINFREEQTNSPNTYTLMYGAGATNGHTHTYTYKAEFSNIRDARALIQRINHLETNNSREEDGIRLLRSLLNNPRGSKAHDIVEDYFKRVR